MKPSRLTLRLTINNYQMDIYENNLHAKTSRPNKSRSLDAAFPLFPPLVALDVGTVVVVLV